MKIEEIKKVLQPCCGDAPDVSLTKCGIRIEITVTCKHCKAYLHVMGGNLADLIATTQKEWNCGAKTVIPFEVKRIRKAGEKL